MEEHSISINFNSVSNFTGVTKAWLYKQKDVIVSLSILTTIIIALLSWFYFK